MLAGEQNDPLSAHLYTLYASLLPSLTQAEFADICTQTICYILFAARLHAVNNARTYRTRVADLIPATDQLVCGLLAYIAAPDLHARIICLLEDLLTLLDDAGLPAGAYDAGQEPLLYFYEAFLRAYNPQVRAARGVYLTPEPVVSYIVRSVDALLRRDFGLTAGLAATRDLHVLDPALGTGAFLHGIIDHVSASSQHGPQPPLPRLVGYELLPAPSMIAHIGLSLKLAAIGYDLRTDTSELRVYLTNALEETQPGQQAARVQVVLGNPPYANSGMLNKNAWIQSLLVDYKRDLHEKKLNLDDDCIKFMRLGQWRIQQAGSGILAFITNRTYLEGITHRRMRQSLLETFSAIYILDLHGGYGERMHGGHPQEHPQAGHPQGAPLHFTMAVSEGALPRVDDFMKDENVFDIRQGVAIGIFVRKPEHTPGMAEVYHADLWGARDSKYAYLATSDLTSTAWTRLEPQPAHYFFVPQQFERGSEWHTFVPLTSIFRVFSTGIKTHLDAVLVGETDAQVAWQIDRFVGTYGRDEAALPARRGSAAHKATLLKRELLAHPDHERYRDYAYRPFDIRRIAYQPTAIEAGDHRFPVMRHALDGSMLLATTRQLSGEAFSHVFVSNTLTDMCLLSTATRECAYCFPLYLYPSSNEHATAKEQRHPNIAPWFVADLAARLHMTYASDGKGNLRETFGPQDIFNYAYALLHAPGYRTRYASFLRIDFPRLPPPTQPALFRKLCDAGAKLVSLHLLQVQPAISTSYPVAGTDLVEQVHYTPSEQDAQHGRVWVNATQYFDAVPLAVWHFELGGYHICHKWLKDRKGRRLSHADLAHYQRMIAALAETVRVMEEIDELFHNIAFEYEQSPSSQRAHH